jgi:oligogalacturonide lyase
MWLVNEDGSNVRKVKEHAEGESCTHEFWVPNGSALVYVSYLKGQQGRTIYSFNPDTGVNDAVMQMPACSHLMSNFDGTMLVGDGSGTPVDVKDTSGYTIDNDPYLYAFDVAKKAYFRIARHDTSWATVANSRQVTHPHHPLPRMTKRFCTVPIKTANLLSISRNSPSNLKCCNMI